MAEYRRYRRRARQSTKVLMAKFTALAVAATLIIGGLLAAQMANGNDPALGPKATASAKKSAATPSGSSTSSSSSAGSGTDPYSQSYGYGYSTGSNGYSAGAGSPQQSSPAPVTSGTS
jgi:hypothetical protein